MNSNYSSIIEIGNILVSEEILTEYFCCDYEQCCGVCCIVGDSGAPLEKSEVRILKREYRNYKKKLSPEGIKRIEEVGFYEIDNDGDYVTPLLGHSEECAYTLMEDGNCFCAIERAFCEGKCKFQKPISCSLYPIRVSTLSNGMKALNLHRWNICQCAFEKGRKEKLPVYKFLKEPLIRAFGSEFYDALCAAAQIIGA